MKSSCFICNLDNDVLNKEAGGFDVHVKQDHNVGCLDGKAWGGWHGLRWREGAHDATGCACACLVSLLEVRWASRGPLQSCIPNGVQGRHSESKRMTPPLYLEPSRVPPLPHTPST
jgi:hypothetical protein